ncbi:MAG: phage tail sheath family protein [Rhodoferax sp.]|uniref:phage tail sheath family protein n=1 Tax=Rhodoferax sp. TaxID=50421 RepID=UPI002728DECE|nr:phage tail sheath family protein [Rhodoferax sp.]MDO8449483.1 phage tail sheath family protein [Rhodoferax sp.]
MSEYLAPGVYVEETSVRPKSIEGVATSTCAFVGPTSKGPVGVAPELLTSFTDYERIYGGVDDLAFDSDTKALHQRNYIAHAARAFFENGGQRLYVVRVVTGFTGSAEGAVPDANEYAAALSVLVDLADVSIVAAPGYSAFVDLGNGSVYRAIQTALLMHVAEPLRYRIAVLDAPPDVTPEQMRELRSELDSSRAALYYPWVITPNPLAGANSAQPLEIVLPPSGFVCGIYARSDIERGVHKAPANEIVHGALRFELAINAAQQELLNPMGVNCLRAFRGRGLRVWGARTVSNDPEWKYLNVRRYFNYLGASIDRGTQWAVFEPNGSALWANVCATISDFLYNEWRSGALLGSKPEEAYFVRCDRTTMTQDDIDHGRLVCLIGVAMVKPAEFMIMRIAQMTTGGKP